MDIAAIALSALVAGTLDITATGALMKAQGVPFRRLLQGVASGALGRSAYEGGSRTAAIGLALHFLIAAFWATLYCAAAAQWRGLPAHPILFGAVYGVVVHLIMSRLVLPLSRLNRPFSWKAWLTQIPIHIVCVGIPIALVQSYWP